MYRSIMSPIYHLFRLKIKPSSNDMYARVSIGFATIVVVGSDPTKSLQRAREYLEDQGWEVLECDIYPTLAEEETGQIENPELTRVFRSAKNKGIGCHYDFGIGGGAIFN